MTKRDDEHGNRQAIYIYPIKREGPMLLALCSYQACISVQADRRARLQLMAG